MTKRVLSLFLALVLVVSLMGGMAAFASSEEPAAEQEIVEEATSDEVALPAAGESAPIVPYEPGVSGASTEPKTVTLRINNPDSASITVIGGEDTRSPDNPGGGIGNPTSLENGSQITVDSNGYRVEVTVNTEGYVVTSGVEMLHIEQSGNTFSISLYPASWLPGEVTINIVKGLKLSITGDTDAVIYTQVQSGSVLVPGDHYRLEVKNGYRVDMTNAELTSAYYYDNGDEIICEYGFAPTGEGDVILHIVQDDAALRRMIPITYSDPDGVLRVEIGHSDLSSSLPKQVMAGGRVGYVLEDTSYYVAVEGGSVRTDEYEGRKYVSIEVDTDATELKVTVRKAVTGATLTVKDDVNDDSLVTGAVALVYDADGVYLGNGDVLEGISGSILLKNGYTVTDVEGAVIDYERYACDVFGSGNIYKQYRFTAEAKNIVITIEEEASAQFVYLVSENHEGIGGLDYGNCWFYEMLGYYTGEKGAHLIVPADWYVTLLKGYKMYVTGLEITGTEDIDNLHQKVYLRPTALHTSYLIVRGDFGLKVETPPEVADEPVEAVTPGVADAESANDALYDAAYAMVSSVMEGNSSLAGSTGDAEDIKEALANLMDVNVSLAMQPVEAPAAKEALDAKAPGTVIGYIDIDILVKATVGDYKGEGVTDIDIGAITETDEAIEFAVAVPEEMLTGNSVCVIREHAGEIDILPATLEGNVVHFKSDKFSTFAISISDDDSGKNPPAGSEETPNTNPETKPDTSDSSKDTGSPKTGDETNIALYAVILALSGSALGAVIFGKKKNRI